MTSCSVLVLDEGDGVGVTCMFSIPHLSQEKESLRMSRGDSMPSYYMQTKNKGVHIR